MDEKEQKDFLTEEIKIKPINRRKLFRRTAITVSMALVFGAVACVTFVVLMPWINKTINPKEEVVYNIVKFPEDMEEVSPSDLMYGVQEKKEDVPATPRPTFEPIAPVGVETDIYEYLQQLSDRQMSFDDYVKINYELNKFSTDLQKYLVLVKGVISERDWFNDTNQRMNTSTGVIVAENGVELLILAEYSPLARAEEITVSFKSGLEVSAYLKGLDKDTGYGMFAVELDALTDDMRENLPIVELGNTVANTIYENPVLAIGQSFGRTGLIGYGRVLANNTLTDTFDTAYSLLQTDIICGSDVNGMLFNSQGRLLGVITRRGDNSETANLVSVYGISSLKDMMEKLANGVPRSYLGIKGIDVSDEANKQGVPKGAFITGINMNSPAMISGLQRGDVITAVNKENVYTYIGLLNILCSLEPEETVNITVLRKSVDEYKAIVFEVELKEKQ